ncbi:DUF309 domain-containing protein [Paenibacillus sp. J22TS3]|uniref:DUF309 domain-containing protein n=1 Tax=Paenibacillus sp. J22TS3 TaxID=2807192 RepID=UPI001B07FA2D|nr:DUF309 domain-containing protein [Paenibacillus sp. J22TS3]GIP21249.1 hypothetical protein J22TS3_15240 [Paenibacillus sp. J22TS3]
MKYDPLYLAYLIYFNRDRDYFECHEVLEELWLAQGREPLYKGLLQVAVGMFHFRRGNFKGSSKMLVSAVDKLEAYGDECLGINLGRLRREIQQLSEKLAGPVPPAYADLTIEIIDDELLRAVETASSEIRPNEPIQIHPQRGEKHALREKRMLDK